MLFFIFKKKRILISKILCIPKLKNTLSSQGGTSWGNPCKSTFSQSRYVAESTVSIILSQYQIGKVCFVLHITSRSIGGDKATAACGKIHPVVCYPTINSAPALYEIDLADLSHIVWDRVWPCMGWRPG